MNRLQSELQRLYLPPSASTAPGEPLATVRAMVLEITRPPSWEVISKVWYGVQAELGLPAPGIAVSGIDGLQLWFSLEAPVAVAQAGAFLDRLRLRFMPDIDVARIRSITAPATVPAREEPGGNWSAFVAPDLAPVFAETPWLDIPPNEEGQASLLRGLQVAEQALFEAAYRRMEPEAPPPAARATPSIATAAAAALAKAAPRADAAAESARRFLLQVMNDVDVALPQRIEAARALLQHDDSRGAA